jgi:hypothetical protein
MSSAFEIRREGEVNYSKPLARALLRDSRLSFGARGLFAFLWDLPGGWRTNTAHLASIVGSKYSDRTWVNIQSARWVNIQSARTDVSLIAGKEAAMMGQRSEQTSDRVNEVSCLQSAQKKPLTAPHISQSAGGAAEIDQSESGLLSGKVGEKVTGDVVAATEGTSQNMVPAEAEKKPAAEQPSEKTNLRCLSLEPGIDPLPHRDGVPQFVYEVGQLEHPAVPGLMLSLEERLYGTALEIVDANGEIRVESVRTERPFRIKWKAPIPVSVGSTSKNFVKLNESLYKKP